MDVMKLLRHSAAKREPSAFDDARPPPSVPLPRGAAHRATLPSTSVSRGVSPVLASKPREVVCAHTPSVARVSTVRHESPEAAAAALRFANAEDGDNDSVAFEEEDAEYRDGEEGADDDDAQQQLITVTRATTPSDAGAARPRHSLSAEFLGLPARVGSVPRVSAVGDAAAVRARFDAALAAAATRPPVDADASTASRSSLGSGVPAHRRQGGAAPFADSQPSSASPSRPASDASGAGDFEPLCEEQLFALYTAVDLDGDGVVSARDLFAFLALNPQCVDAAVGSYAGILRGAGEQQLPYWAQIDARTMAMSPLGEDAIIAEGAPFTWRRRNRVALRAAGFLAQAVDGVMSAATRATRGGTAQASGGDGKAAAAGRAPRPAAISVTADGGLWFSRQRVAHHQRDRKFVDFVLNMAFSVLSKEADAPAAGCGATPTPGADALTATLLRASRVTAPAGSSGMLSPQRGGGVVVPQMLSFTSFCLLYREAVQLLSARENAFMLVMLDMPMLRSVHCFFRFVITLTRRLNRFPAPAAAATAKTLSPGGAKGGDAAARAAALQRHVPVATSIASIFWTVAAWEERRGVFDVPLLQRVGEMFLRRRARDQEKQMRQFLRFYRHLLVAQAAGKGAAGAAALSGGLVGGAAGGGAAGADRPVAGAAAAKGKGKLAATENLSLLRLSTKFRLVNEARMKDHLRHCSPSPPASDALEPSTARARRWQRRRSGAADASDDAGGATSGGSSDGDFDDEFGPRQRSVRGPSTVAGGGSERDSDVASSAGSSADTEPSPSRAVVDHRLTNTLGGGGAAAGVAAGGDGGDEGGGGGGLMHNDFIIHSLIAPEPLSMLASLSAQERRKMSSISFWCAFRAGLYAVVAAIVIGVVNLVAQAFFLENEPNLMETFVVTSQTFFDWASGAFGHVNVSATTAAPTSGLPVASNGTFAPAQSHMESTFSLSAFIKYQLVVWCVSLAVSIAEIVVLYVDNLRVCFSIAKTGGIPLHHYSSRRSELFLRSDENEVTTVKESLTRKRVRFVISAISRCALQIPFDTVTILGIDVKDRNVGYVRRVFSRFFIKLRRSAPTLVLRIFVSRIVSKFAVPFVATPLLAFWNVIVSRRSVYDARMVVLGAIAAERLAHQLLDFFFTLPPQVVRHNERVHQAQQSAAGCRAGGGMLIAGIYSVPFHVYREMLSLIAFFMHVVGDKTVHPALHFFVVHVASHVQTPDQCLLFRPSQSSTAASAKSRGRGAAASVVVEMDGDAEDIAAATLGAQTTASAGSSEKGFVTDVGGSDSYLASWLRTFTRELSSARREMRASGGGEWLETFVTCTSPFDPFNREALASRTCPSLTGGASWTAAKVLFLLEQLFPGWAMLNGFGAAASAAGSAPLGSSRNGAAGASGAMGGATPFTPRDIQLFLTVGTLCVIFTAPSHLNLAKSVRHSTFLSHLLRCYVLSGRTVMWREAIAEDFLSRVQELQRRYRDGFAIDLQHITTAVERAISTSL